MKQSDRLTHSICFPTILFMIKKLKKKTKKRLDFQAEKVHIINIS